MLCSNSVLGTGGSLTVSLCDAETNFDTQISVFGRSCFFDGFCQGGNDDSVDEACGRTSEYTWQSEPFTKYLVAIHGFNNETGTFGLLFDDLGDAPSYSSCAEAAGPLPLGETVPISLFNAATIDDGYLACGPASGSPISSTGVWLQAVGDGGTMTASVCEKNPSGTSFRVFTGACNSLICVPEASGVCNSEWESEFSVTYYIFVSWENANLIVVVMPQLSNILPYFSDVRSKGRWKVATNSLRLQPPATRMCVAVPFLWKSMEKQCLEARLEQPSTTRFRPAFAGNS
jgi:hypothetical protein